MSYSRTMRSAPTSPRSPSPDPPAPGATAPAGLSDPDGQTILGRLLRAVAQGRPRPSSGASEEFPEQLPAGSLAAAAFGREDRALGGAGLRLRDRTAADVMIPHADIAALDIATPSEEVMRHIAERGFSLYPVYRETLDNIVGTVHIKDILKALAASRPLALDTLVREALIVSPALPALDLLAQMRQAGKHMAMVIDEYGGIDGLVTVNDITRLVIGEIGDERDPDSPPEMVENPDGSVTVDARVSLEDFARAYGGVFSSEDSGCDTLGGLVTALAGRVPACGERIAHPSGAVFEIVEADPRRVRKMTLRDLPRHAHASGQARTS